MKKRYNKNKGITLIALVVTIVILIILATVSINVMVSENGIIIKAREARFKTEVSEYKEIISINKLGDIFEYRNSIWNLKEQLEKQMQSLDVAKNNAEEMIEIIIAVEEGDDYIQEILQSLNAIIVQCRNSNLSVDELEDVKKQINSKIEEINNIVDTTSYNGKKLLNGNLGKETPFVFILGNGEYVYAKKEIVIESHFWKDLYGTEDIDLSKENIDETINNVKAVFEKINFERSKFGSLQNNMTHQVEYFIELKEQIKLMYDMIFFDNENYVSDEEAEKRAKSWNTTTRFLNSSYVVYEKIYAELIRIEELVRISKDREDREFLQMEVDVLLENINLQITNTGLANKKIFDGSFPYIETISLESLGINGCSVLTEEMAKETEEKINNAFQIIEDKKNRVNSKINEINSFVDLWQEADYGCAFNVDKIENVENVIIEKEYEDKLQVIGGELVYIGDDILEKEWAIEIGIKTK